MTGYRKASLITVAGLFMVLNLFGAANPQLARAITIQRYIATYGIDDTDCSVSDDPCLTLAYAVTQSNGGDTINIAAGNYPTANAPISKSLTIQGAGRDTTQLDGGGTTRLLSISAGPIVINDLTVANGNDTGFSGGIYSAGANLTLNRVKLTANTGNFGGGLYFNNGTLVINDSVFSGNTGNNGGGFYLGGTGTTTINRTAVINNQGLNNGAFQNSQSGELNVTSSTLYGNSCTGTSCNGVTSVQSVAIVRFINSTITGNQSHDAALIMNGGTCSFKNSIIALNYDGGTINDCRTPNGLFTSYGYNLRSDTDCGTAAHDIYSTSPLLGILQDNGGPTQTVGLLPGSPAINAGPVSDCPAVDQRGFTRPRGTACDIGAVEFQPIGSLSKTSPADTASGLLKDVTLEWGTSTDATGYSYCFDTVDDDDCTWIDNIDETSITLTNLSPGDTYFWQVKATGYDDIQYANGSLGAFWSFGVLPLPEDFWKSAPADNVTNRPPNLTLSWQVAAGAESYAYCIDKSNNDSCGTGWIDVGTATSAALINLAPGTYYWQVRAANSNGETLADYGDWWTFKVPPKPGALNKITPTNNSVGKPTTLTLYWEASSNAVKYEYCLKKIVSAACTWKSVGTAKKVTLTGLLKNTKYFWQVRAKNATGTTLANGGVFWNFTTKP